MKKILFLLLICFLKLSAYDYLIYSSNELNLQYQYYRDVNGILTTLQIFQNGEEKNYTNSLVFMSQLGQIQRKHYLGGGYIDYDTFVNYYKNDLLFLNDLYTQQTQPFLNFIYNLNGFTEQNYIQYDNYEILYNLDGLAVESIINGNWAGLYDGPDHSGFLYDEKGDLKYINGVSPSFFESIFNKLMRRFGINLQSIFIKKIFYPLLILIFACVVLRAVIRLAFKAFLIRFYDKKIGQLEKRREKIENA